MHSSVIHSISEIRLRSEEGVSLVAAVFIIILLSSIAVAVSTYVWANSRMNALTAGEIRAIYAAESGREYAFRRSSDIGSYNWTRTDTYAGANVRVTVTTLGSDSVEIQSRARYGVTARQITHTVSLIDFTQYSVYITGVNQGIIGFDSADRLRYEVIRLADINIDSLQAVAVSQGRYYSGNLKITNAFPTISFWSNPFNQNQNANITFVEKNLTVEKNNGPLRGIYVVKGNITFKKAGTVDGVLYLVRENGTSKVSCNGNSTFRTISGGIVGQTNLKGEKTGWWPRLTVNYNGVFISKFYTYTANNKTQYVENLSWQLDY
jgi:hypothetical protein